MSFFMLSFSFYFYPRPPRGGRLTAVGRAEETVTFLSTPSARRATVLPISSLWSVTFLSTPSARRATGFFATLASSASFLSTPSARRATSFAHATCFSEPISIHALREEGDGGAGLHYLRLPAFLSTPSARRATAKTETKALFSNKLYNILHEFRRALIYNWSKNYPNRAK